MGAGSGVRIAPRRRVSPKKPLEASHGKTQSSGGARCPRAQRVRAERDRVRACDPPQEGKAATRQQHKRKRAWCTRCPRRSWIRASSAPRRASLTSSKSSAKKCTPSITCGSARTSSTAGATRSCTGGRRTTKEYQWSSDHPHSSFETGPCFEVELDNDGNATAIVMGGPSCASGESLISAHLTEAARSRRSRPGSRLLPPRPTPPGVFVTPAKMARLQASRARPQRRWRRSFRSSSRRCSPRNRCASTSRSLGAAPNVPYTEVLTLSEHHRGDNGPNAEQEEFDRSHGYPEVEKSSRHRTVYLDNDGKRS